MAMNYGKIDNFIVDNDVMTIAEKNQRKKNFLMNVTMKMTLRKDVIFSCR